MNLVKFLQSLVIKDWKLWNEGEKLHYNAPHEQSASSVLYRLKQHKVEIIQLLRDRPDIFNVYPLSHGQKALWFLQQLDPLSSAYNQIFTSRIYGNINVKNFRLSFEEILDRHPSLRTTFPKLDEEPIQQVHQEKKVDFQQVDASDWSQPELYLSVYQESQRPFDLEHESVMRVRLFTYSREEHIFLLTIHHIATDGWSLDIILSELSKLYQAQQDGSQASLPILKNSYSDYVYFQNKKLEGSEGEKLWNYWQDRLKGELPRLNLHTDKPRPPIQTYNGASHNFQLSSQLTQKLKQLAISSDATLYMILLAAFEVLLYRYTGQEDILVGSPIAGRLQSQFRGIVGYFANMLVLQGDLSNNPSFEQVIAQVRQTVLEALSHQDYPFGLLIQKLQPHRDPSRSPIFQVSFSLQKLQESQNLQNLFIDEIGILVDWGGLKLGSFQMPQQVGQFDLGLEIFESEESLCSVFKYNTDLFNRQTIERLSSHFLLLLEAIVVNPEFSITQLPLLTEPERQQLLYEWNDTTVDFPSDLCVHQLLEQQVEQTPEAIAVVFEDEHLTYQELNQKANQLAHYLQSLGVEPDVPVGICLERSLEMVIALLGVLKAGGAYIPLDPTYPQERLIFMLEDSQTSVLLTHSSVTKWAMTLDVQVVLLDQLQEHIAAQPRTSPESAVSPENLAYVIYTSGSTGTPKGVLNSHSGLVNRICWMQSSYQLNYTERVLQKTPFSFDVSVWEFLWPLMSGSCLVIAKPEGQRDNKYLSELIVHECVTTLHFVPSMLQVFLKHSEIKENHSLQRVFCSGETLSFTLKEQFFGVLQRVELHNLYGPTEAAIDVTSFKCKLGGNSVPIGRPIANTQIYLLDALMQPVPIGTTGEIYIGGVGVARGYLNQPELTARKFIQDPFSDSPGARLYRTGDLGRYRPDGNLEYIGRIDNQVKLRGFRIELGEIEAALAQHSTVMQAVVIAQGESADNKHLVAYVVANLENAVVQPEDELQTEHLADWQQLYERLYSQTSETQDSTFNIIGWNSSYTGSPIPAEEMREWVDYTVTRILELHPQQVLEIGCGTGLLLSRIAPYCVHYCATDYSQAVLQHLQQLKQSVRELDNVTLLQRMADDFEGIEAETFDTIIINSVVQYFPSIHYLLKVIEGAIHAARPGGSIFIGDIRSLSLLEAYHTSVALYQASDDCSLEKLQQRMQQRLGQEAELVIDPAFFIALKQQFPKIRQVQIQPQRGHHHNELTRFRYEAILHLEPEISISSAPLEIVWQDWSSRDLRVADIHKLLLETQPMSLGLQRVGNARVHTEVKTLEAFQNLGEVKTVGELQASLMRQENSGIAPEDLWDLGQALPYEVEISWSRGYSDGSYDVVFKHCSAPGEVVFEEPKRSMTSIAWSGYGNNPLQGKLTQKLVPQLRQHLQSKLPEYMVPSFFVLLEELPLTPNGKIDRKALPDSQILRTDIQFVAARNPAEEVLSLIWAEVLNIEKVSIHDNFFEIGGHSLLATQLISRVRQDFDLELPLIYLFEKPTVAGVVEVMANLMGGQEVIDEIARVLQETEQLSAEEVQSMLAQMNRENS